MAGGPKAPASAILLVATVAEGREHRDVFPAKQCFTVNSPKALGGATFETAYYTPAAMAADGEKATESWLAIRRYEARWHAPRIGREVRVRPLAEFELGDEA